MQTLLTTMRAVPASLLLLITAIACSKTCKPLRAQDYASSALGRGLNAGVAHVNHTDISNPAILGALEDDTITIWNTTLFGLREIRLASARVATRYGGLGLASSIHSLKFDSFSQTDVVVSLGIPVVRTLTEPTTIGVTAAVRTTSASSGINTTSHFIRVGVIVPMNDRTYVAAIIQRTLNGPSFSSSTARVGASYFVSDRLSVHMDLYSEVGFPISYRLGVQAAGPGGLTLVLGTRTDPDTVSGGFDLTVGQFSIRSGADFHSVLGLSSTAELSVRI